MSRQMVSSLLLCVLLALQTRSALAVTERYAEPPPIAVEVDGRAVSLSPGPLPRAGRLFLPVRALAEALGAEVAWDPDNMRAVVAKTVRDGDPPIVAEIWPTGERPDRVVVSQSLGRRDVFRLDVPAFVEGGRTYLPFRFLAEAFGYGVEWNGDSLTALVATDRPAEPSDFFRVMEFSPVVTRSGRFQLVEPDDGYPFYPATLRTYRELIGRANTIIGQIDRTTHTEEAEPGRLRYRDARGQVALDVYPWGAVRWMDEVTAEYAILELDRQAKLGGFLSGGAGALLGLVFGKEYVALKVLLGAFTFGEIGWKIRGLSVDRAKTCLAVARIRARRDGSEPMVGWVYGNWGFSGCLDEFKERVDSSVLN